MSGAKSQLDKDVDSACTWLTQVAIELVRSASDHDRSQRYLLDKARMISACASLPGDMPLRVRLFPNVFYLTA